MSKLVDWFDDLPSMWKGAVGGLLIALVAITLVLAFACLGAFLQWLTGSEAVSVFGTIFISAMAGGAVLGWLNEHY